MLFDLLTNNLQESFLIPLIGLLLATFLQRTVAYVVEDPELHKGGSSWYFTRDGETPEQKAERERRDGLLKEERRRIFSYSMILGVVSLILGLYGFLQAARDPRISAPSRGVALGGFLLVLYNTINRWNEFQELIRLAVLGLSFVSLAAAAYYFS